MFLCQLVCVPLVARRRNGRPLKQKHLADKYILRFMREEDEEAIRGTAMPGREASDRDHDQEHEHVYHLLRFGVLSEPFTPAHQAVD